ncbi:hypothetical protein ACSS6W_006675 [Trichoderma asperelloides]
MGCAIREPFQGHGGGRGATCDLPALESFSFSRWAVSDGVESIDRFSFFFWGKN